MPVKKHLFTITMNGEYAYAIGKEGIYLRSGDGGATWQQIDIGAKFYLQNIALYDNSGWIVGAHGWVLKTQDRGESFTVVRSAPSGVSFIRLR